jgi:hypothetical protein
MAKGVQHKKQVKKPQLSIKERQDKKQAKGRREETEVAAA